MDKYDAYLFDWDGTLCQTLEIWLKMIKSLLADYDLHPSDKDIVLKMFGRAPEGLADFGLSAEQIDTFIDQLRDIAPDRVASADLYPDVRELLDVLANNNKKLVLITASMRDVVDIVMTKHDLLETFDLVITGSDIEKHKPDPEGILFALEHLGIDKSRALMIGDSDKDLGAAANAGVDSLLFFPPGHAVFHDRDHLQDTGSPRFTVAGWQEMIQAIQ